MYDPLDSQDFDFLEYRSADYTDFTTGVYLYKFLRSAQTFLNSEEEKKLKRWGGGVIFKENIHFCYTTKQISKTMLEIFK